MPLAHAEIDAALAAGRRPIVVGGTGLYLRAALAELSLVKAPPEAEDSELWSPETRHPTTIFGLDMDRARLYERIDARVEAIVAAGAAEEARRAEALGPGRTARKALGFDELLAGDVELMKKRSRNYARRQLTWMRKIPNLHPIDRTDLSDAEVAADVDGPNPVRIGVFRPVDGEGRLRRREIREVAGAGQRLPDPRGGRTSPGSSARSGSSGSATRISGSAPTGCCCSRRSEDPEFVADLRIFNPDGSEAELSGNGAREAILYLRRHGWTDAEDASRSAPSPGRSCRRSPAS